jgi:hypothetical protein
MKANGSFHWNCILKQMLSLATVFAIVLAGAPSAAFAQVRSTSQQKAAAVSAPAPEATRAKKAPSQGGGQQEGIKVHGHWTIEVLNPDGSLVKHYEFDNALEPTGKTTLASLLTRNSSPGFWIVLLQSSSCIGTGDCAALLEAGDPLGVTFTGTPPTPSPVPGVYLLNPPSLALVDPNDPLAGVALALEGRATVWEPRFTQIESVSTMLKQCPPGISAAEAISSPQLCNSSSSGSLIIPLVPFTKHVLAAPISNLVQGQILTIKVVFTFS